MHVTHVRIYLLAAPLQRSATIPIREFPHVEIGKLLGIKQGYSH
jgi:hypothetical protein